MYDHFHQLSIKHRMWLWCLKMFNISPHFTNMYVCIMLVWPAYVYISLYNIYSVLTLIKTVQGQFIDLWIYHFWTDTRFSVSQCWDTEGKLTAPCGSVGYNTSIRITSSGKSHETLPVWAYRWFNHAISVENSTSKPVAGHSAARDLWQEITYTSTYQSCLNWPSPRGLDTVLITAECVSHAEVNKKLLYTGRTQRKRLVEVLIVA